jgi:hypothetical protein
MICPIAPVPGSLSKDYTLVFFLRKSLNRKLGLPAIKSCHRGLNAGANLLSTPAGMPVLGERLNLQGSQLYIICIEFAGHGNKTGNPAIMGRQSS